MSRSSLSMGSLGSRRPKQQRYRAPLAPVTPEEEEGILSRVVLPGLEMAGNLLDLPSSMVRDVATLQNPLDQLLSPLSSENRITGRQMLEKRGVLGPNRYEGLESWKHPADIAGDLAGVAAEIVPDLLFLPKLLPAAIGKVFKGAAVGSKEAGKITEKVLADAAEMAATTARQAGKAAGLGEQAIEESAATAARSARADKLLEAVRQAQKPEATAKGMLPNTPASVAEQLRNKERAVAEWPLLSKVLGLKEPLQLKTGSETAANIIDALYYGNESRLGRAASFPMRAVRSILSAEKRQKMGGATQKIIDLEIGRRQQHLTSINNAITDVDRVGGDLAKEYGKIARHFKEEGMPEVADEMVADGEALAKMMTDAQQGFYQFAQASAEDTRIFPRGLTDTMPADPKGSMELMGEYLADALGVDPDAVTEHADEFLRKSHQYVEMLQRAEDMVHQTKRKYGLVSPELSDELARHMARRGKHGFTMDSDAARTRFLRGVPGGTAAVQRASMDPNVAATHATKELLPKTQAEKNIWAWYRAKDRWGTVLDLDGKPIKRGEENLKRLQEAYLRDSWLLPELRKARQRGPIMSGEGANARELTDTEILEPWLKEFKYPDMSLGYGDKAIKTEAPLLRQFVNYLRKAPEAVRDEGLFQMSIPKVWHEYMKGEIAKLSVGRAAHDLLRQKNVIHELKEGVKPRPGDVPLKEAWGTHNKRTGLGAGFTDEGLETLMESMKRDKGAWANMTVSQQTANALKAHAEFAGEKTPGEFAKLYDKIQAAYRGWLYMVWPASQVRNFTGDRAREISHGKVRPDEIFKGAYDAFRHVRTNGEKPLEFIDEIIARKIVKPGLLAQEMRYVPGETVDIPTKGFLGKGLKGGTWWERLDPKRFRGVVDMKEGEQPVLNWAAQIGENVNDFVQFIGRAGYYNALRKKGFDPDAAERLMREVHFDAADLSEWERTVAKRLFLFYGWKRASLPYTFARIIQEPGGAQAQMIRGLRHAGSPTAGVPGSYIPKFLREKMAMPVGETEDGQTTYLSQLGFHTDDLSQLTGGPSPMAALRRAGERQVGELAPWFSGGYGWLSGREPYSGRPTKHLRSPLEEITGPTPQWLNKLIHISPASRVVSSLAQGIDPRKAPWERALNLTTGLKFTTQDPERYKVIDMLDAVREGLDEEPVIREGRYQYVPDRYKAGAPADIQKRIERTRELQAVLAARSK